MSPIIGRRVELVALKESMLADRLVTLTGVGGIGKTRLVLELAAQAVGRDEHGPYFVDLAPIGDAALVPAALAAAVGVAVPPNADVMTVVRAALDRHPVLAVIDNCEHLLPGVAELIGALLLSSPGVRVLATSREPLGVAGERACPIDPLRMPPATASLEQIEQSDGGALFLARLPMNRAAEPMRPAELVAVGTICRRLDGIPLGLELAAARSRTLSLPELAERLDRSISELAPARHGVTARHRTMSAALDWGFELLTPSAQEALRAMSVFAGGCDLAAFIAVCHDDAHSRAVDVLDELVRTSFATVEFTGGSARYRMLEPVRQYARAQLDDTGDATDRRRRHLGHYLDVARSLTKNHADGLGETKFDQLGPELDNFRAALDFAAGDAEATEPGLSLATRLFDAWVRDGRHHEGLARLVGLLACGGGSPAVRSRAAYGAGFIASDLGRDRHAFALWQQALAEAHDGGDKLAEIAARRVLADFAFLMSGDVATARQHLETAIELADAEANEYLHARCVTELANLHFVTGALDEAIDWIHQVLDGPAGASPVIEGHANGVLGDILYDRGAYPAARAASTRALALATSEGNLFETVAVHLDLAAIECAAGCFDDSAAHLANAEDLQPDIAHGWDPAFLIARADLALARGDNVAGLAFAEAATALEDESYSAGVQGVANLRFLGDAQLAVGDAATALATYRQLIAKASAGQYACRLADGHDGAAASAYALGKNEDAFEHQATAEQIRRRTRSHPFPRPAVDRYLTDLDKASHGVAPAES